VAAWRKTDVDGALRVRTDDLAVIGAQAGDWVVDAGRVPELVVLTSG
jgi:hypothetical protein